MKVGILTCSTPNRKWLYDITNRTKEIYATRYGYDYIFSDCFYPDRTRHPYWNKIKFIADNMKKYDWVLWLDDDAGFIANTTIEPIFDTNANFLFANDMNGFNSGVMAIKNTFEMQGAMLFIWEKLYSIYKTHEFPEQDALFHLIVKSLNLGKSIDGRKYNAYSNQLTISNINQADESTIILHIAGGSVFKERHKECIANLFSRYN